MKKKWFSMSSKTRLIIGMFVLGGLVGVIGSLVSAEVVKQTSGVEFCGSCHSMKPMAATFKRDIHGGKNDHGFVAECADCHLSHSSVTSYMFEKAAHGINDVFVETFTNTDDINWLERRKNREEFVYDDGCLSCHQQILDKTIEDKPDNPKSLQLHALYTKYKGTEKELKCASCHVTIGHNGELRSELNKTNPEFDFKLKKE